MAQDGDVRLLITQHTEKGKTHLRDAAESRELFHNAIKEFVLAYKNALFLNEDRATEHSCLFNIGSAYVAAGYYDRGIDVLKSVEQLIKQRNVVSTSPSQGDILFNIAFAYDQMKKDDTALMYYDKAKHEYNSQPSSPLLGETLLNMGKIYERKGDALQARACYSRAASLYLGLNKFLQACEMLLAQAELLISTSPVVTYESAEVLAQCQKQALKVDDDVQQANLFYKMALKYTLLTDYDNSLYCFEQAEGLCRRKDKALHANVCQNLGAVHNRLQDYLLAMQYHRKAVKMHGELGNRNAQGQCFCNQAYAEIQLKRLDDAEMSYLHAKQAFRDCDNMYGRWHVYESLAGLSMVKGDFPKAIEHYKRAIKHQANSKDSSTDAQERLIDKLVFTIDQFHRKKNSSRQPAVESYFEEATAIESPKQIDSSEKRDRQPPSAAQESVTEVDAPPESSGPSTSKTYQGGRRDYPEEDQGWKPPQVARGLSSLTERSLDSSRSYMGVNKKDSGLSKTSWNLHSDSDSSLEDILRPRTGSRRRRTPGNDSTRMYASTSAKPKLATQLSFVEEEPNASQQGDSDTPRSAKSDTDYADRYREQIRYANEQRDSPASSSSSSTSDENSVAEEGNAGEGGAVGEAPKSMPRAAPPKPPRSREREAYERPGSSSSDIPTPSRRAKKSLRFQEESPGDSIHLYASVKTSETQKTAEPDAEAGKSPVPSSGDLYDEPPHEDTEEAEATPLYSTIGYQPKDEAGLSNRTEGDTEVDGGSRQPDDTLPSLPRRSPRKKQSSKACIVM